MSKLLYRVNEVTEILAISRSEVYALVHEGKLVGHNDNPKAKGLRITAESIRIYFEAYQIKKSV